MAMLSSRLLYVITCSLCMYITWKFYHNTRRLELCQRLGLDRLKGLEKRPDAPAAPPAQLMPVVVQYCQLTSSEKCVPPLIGYKQRYRTAHKYKLLGCAIEKNFSTMLTAILCYLHNEDKFIKKNRTIVEEMFHQRFCGPVNEFDELSKVGLKFSMKSKIDWQPWTLIAVVRHPFDRFVSGFTDKCLREKTWIKHPDRCNGCQKNLTCFMEKQYKRMMSKAAGENIRANFDDDHFYPQSWRCEFNSHLHDYTILNFDSDLPEVFIENLLFRFKGNNVSTKAIDYIRTSLTAGRTRHSTVDSPERSDVIKELTKNNHLMQLMIRMYYYDYVLFGFPLPLVRNDQRASLFR